ncbi:MAG TPA: hypothetical protein VFA18_05455 [Gemmataceae bacterium]|nr:hypothetical protein [Gemmataceae bacterium]
MALEPHEFAKLLGAEIVGEVPDVGAGPFGMARLAHLMHERLTPSRGERPGRPTNPNWVTRCKVPMSAATMNRLTELARELSTAERKVSPMQLAAQLLEEALGHVGASTGAHETSSAATTGNVPAASHTPAASHDNKDEGRHSKASKRRKRA